MSDFNFIMFENYIYPKILKLKDEYPNDQDFGGHVRSLLDGFNKSIDKNNNFPGVQNL